MPDPHTACYFVSPHFPSSAGARHAVLDPATLETVGQRAEVTADEIQDALAKVTAAQAGWKKLDAADLLEAGMVWINNPMIDNDALPFGGWKSSGLGRELGRQGLDAFRRSKMVIMDHKPARQDWWYPYPDDWFLETGGRKLS